MKKLIAVICLLLIFTGCTTSNSPKEALTKFLDAMHNSNFEEAKKYATSDSQSFLDMINKNNQESDNVYKDKDFTITTEEIKDGDAKVEVKFSNLPVVFRLKKEYNQWKVEFNLDAMINMAKDVMKEKGIDIQKDVDHAIDSIKINTDSLP